MKNEQAREKANRIVERLKVGEGVDECIVPLELRIFGSTIKDKDKPKDLDLLLIIAEVDDIWKKNDSYEVISSGGRKGPEYRTSRDLRKGMKKIHLGLFRCDDLERFKFSLSDDTEVIWSSGLEHKPRYSREEITQ